MGTTRTGKATALLTTLATGLVLPALSVATATDRDARAPGGPRCDGERATLVGTPGDDRLIGTQGRDVIVAGDGHDHIDGRGGDDLVCAGHGADLVRGGAGDDVLYGGPNGRPTRLSSLQGDILEGGDGDDRLVPGEDPWAEPGLPRAISHDVISFARSDRGVVVDMAAGTARGEGRDRIVGDGLHHVVGTRFDDVVRMAGRAPVATTGAGDDRIQGSSRKDLARPAAANLFRRDGFRLSPGIGTGGQDVVRLGDGADDLVVGDSAGDLRTGPGDDVVEIHGAAASGRVDLGTGRDVAVLTDVPPTPFALVSADDGGTDIVSVDLTRLRAGRTVTWDLGTGRFTRPDGRVSSILGARLVGFAPGPHDISVTGTPRGEELSIEAYGDGSTTFDAGAGNDRFWGGEGDDVFDGGEGTDTYVDDHLGTDTCVSVEIDPQEWCDLRQ